jgi:hypothetical protein
MSGHYDTASDRGISKKWLKKKVKGRDLERKADALGTISKTMSVPNFRC